MAKSENWEKGTKVRRQLLGEGAVQAMSKDVYNDPIMEKFGDYAREAVFGMLWTRPGLDMKTRALICIVSDTAIHAWPELAVHLRMARRMGWSEDELIEALMHMNGYVGLPTVREAMIVARDLFVKMRAEPDGGLGE
jgi:4-carboxymuconolactone decarboxylase